MRVGFLCALPRMLAIHDKTQVDLSEGYVWSGVE